MKLRFTSPSSYSSRRFLILLASAHLAMIGSVAFDHIIQDDFSSLIRAIIASLFMLTVPGILVIRILRVSLRPLDTGIYSVGISLAFTMLIGVSLNSILPVFGVERPLREDVVVTAFVCTTLLLSAIAYFRTRFDREKEDNLKIEIPLGIVSYLLLLIVVSILGATYINNYGSSSFALLFLVLVCMVPVLVALKKIPASLYPATIAACGVALLFHKALISQYLTGWDVNGEYEISNIVLNNSFWQVGTSNSLNSELSTSIIAPGLTEVTGIPLIWVYKVVYPILYSLVPVGLYRLVSPMVGKNIAFFSSFFLISTFVFIQMMIDLPRQEIGEIFVILLIIQLFSDSMRRTANRTIISLICIVSLVVSHYAVAIVFAIMIVWSWGYLRVRKSGNQSTNPISGRLVATYLVLLFIWYSTVASSNIFNTIVNYGQGMWNGIFTDFLTTQSSQIVNLAVNKILPMHEVTKYLLLLSEVLAMIGILMVLVRRNRYRITRSYSAFAISSVVLLLICVFVPFFTATMNFGRLYQISLLGLAPFFVLGFTLTKRGRNPSLGAMGGIVVAVFLSGLLLFNSGFVYEITGETSYISVDAEMDYPRFVKQEIISAEWLSNNRDKEMHVYVDDYRWLLLLSFSISTSSFEDSEGVFRPTAESYAYLGRENVINNNIVLTNWTIGTSPKLESRTLTDTEVASVLAASDRIFDNGASAVFMIYG